jgi:hypothetical protein
MISSEVQRTLVKSPPELWAEISDPESLARHLGEFGEIRITRVQPEQKVEWEADDASGTVVIKPSGWGTKVKLTVTRELAQPEPADESSVEGDESYAAADGELEDEQDEQPSAHAPEQIADVPAQDVELEHDAAGTTAFAHEPPDVAELEDDELEVETDDASIGEALELESPTEPEPRRGFFARLFGRRRSRTTEPGAVSLAEPESDSIEHESLPNESQMAADDFDLERATDSGPADEQETVASAQRLDEPEALEDEPDETPADVAGTAEEQPLAEGDALPAVADEPPEPDAVAARTKLSEEIAAEEVTAVLTGVLDRLGAAHHRPFSRA